MRTRGSNLASIAAILAAFAFPACTTSPTHSPKDYAGAVAAGDPDGSLTTIVGPVTAVVKMKSTVKFPQGDTVSGVRSVLMYDHPNTQPGFCTFEIGHRIQWSIVREERVKRPCDGKHWARFRVAGTDIGFIAHLTRTNYKGTPVTLLEISDHHLPDSMQVVY